jgi:hypothetical protein
MDRSMWIVAALAAGAGAWWWYASQGQAPVARIALADAAVGQSYSPWMFWMHHQMEHMPKNHPSTICPANFAAAVQNEDSGLSLRGLEVDCASCAQ